jgi:cell pole-organizing protein PopZ
MSNPQHEPTMEEILASIRKIISEDTPEAPAAPAPAPAPVAAAPAPARQPEPEPVIETDVLELTQAIDEPPPQPARFAPPPARSENDVVFETIEETPAVSEATSSDGIFSDHTRKAVEDVFANISTDEPVASAPAAAPAFTPVDGRSVEAVFEKAVRDSFDPVLAGWLGNNSDAVIERMKPLIREWMDEHFPALLEGAVRNEVARVVKARGK